MKVQIEVWQLSPQTDSEYLSQTIRKEFKDNDVKKRIVEWLTMWKTEGEYDLTVFRAYELAKWNDVKFGSSWIIKGTEIKPSKTKGA